MANPTPTLVQVATTVTAADGSTGALSGVIELTSPTPPPSDDVLTVQEYLGCFRLQPEDGGLTSFAYGGLAGRKRPDGGLSLYLAITDMTWPGTVIEIADPETYSLDYRTAPLAAPRLAWLDNICQHKRGTWLTSAQRNKTVRTIRNLLLHAPNPILEGWLDTLLKRTPRDPYTWYEFYPGQAPLGGLYYHPEREAIYWSYADLYNVSGLPNWNIGATRLHADGTVDQAFGPWRPSTTDKDDYTAYGPWASGFLARHPNGDLLTGTTLQSGNAGSPWGPHAVTGNTFPPLDLDTMAPHPLPTRLIRHYYMGGKISADGVAQGPVLSMRRPAALAPYWEAQGTQALNINQAHYGGVTSWRQVDLITGVELLEYHGKRALIFWGLNAAKNAHEWYSNVGVGSLYCPNHGVPPPVSITGPVCTETIPVFISYRVEDIERIVAGELEDYAAEPHAYLDLAASFGVHIADPATMASGFNSGYFDPDTGRYFLISQRADEVTIPGALSAVIHVFRLG